MSIQISEKPIHFSLQLYKAITYSTYKTYLYIWSGYCKFCWSQNYIILFARAEHRQKIKIKTWTHVHIWSVVLIKVPSSMEFNKRLMMDIKSVILFKTLRMKKYNKLILSNKTQLVYTTAIKHDHHHRWIIT